MEKNSLIGLLLLGLRDYDTLRIFKKTFKPYLSLVKTTEEYVLTVVLSVSKDYSVESIEQEEIDVSGYKYWGVIITVSSKTQLMNGPDLPILSITEGIDLSKSETYDKIKCVVQQVVPEGLVGPAEDEDTDIGFDDGE